MERKRINREKRLKYKQRNRRERRTQRAKKQKTDSDYIQQLEEKEGCCVQDRIGKHGENGRSVL